MKAYMLVHLHQKPHMLPRCAVDGPLAHGIFRSYRATGQVAVTAGFFGSIIKPI